MWLILRNDGHPIVWDENRADAAARRCNAADVGSRRTFPESRPGRTTRAAHDKNNLKMLALAMYSYHDVNRHFPPAVVIGPDGKTPHSWRVEVLPFVDGGALYHQYRMDEPWDSPANKQILEQMPDVFRSPYDDPKSTNSGYFCSHGLRHGRRSPDSRHLGRHVQHDFCSSRPSGAFPGRNPKTFRSIRDKPLPTLGGFVPGEFVAVMCDGSVHRFKIDQVKDQLKWLIQRNDGQPINLKRSIERDRPRPSGRPGSPDAGILTGEIFTARAVSEASRVQLQDRTDIAESWGWKRRTIGEGALGTESAYDGTK